MHSSVANEVNSPIPSPGCSTNSWRRNLASPSSPGASVGVMSAAADRGAGVPRYRTPDARSPRLSRRCVRSWPSPGASHEGRSERVSVPQTSYPPRRARLSTDSGWYPLIARAGSYKLLAERGRQHDAEASCNQPRPSLTLNRHKGAMTTRASRRPDPVLLADPRWRPALSDGETCLACFAHVVGAHHRGSGSGDAPRARRSLHSVGLPVPVYLQLPPAAQPPPLDAVARAAGADPDRGR